MTPKQIKLQDAIMLPCGIHFDTENKENIIAGHISGDYWWTGKMWIPVSFDATISLPRVLTTLKHCIVNKGGRGRALVFWDNAIYDWSYPALDNDQKICDRKLLKDDVSDCTLFEQSQETQDILFDIICKNF